MEQYCVARFSSEDKDDLEKDLMSVALTVQNAEVCARVERVIERFRSPCDDALSLVDRESAKARFDRFLERLRFDEPTTDFLQWPPWPAFSFTPSPRVNFESTLDELEPSAVTVDGRKLYARSEVEQVIQDLTKELLYEDKMIKTPPDIPTWPVFHLKSIALAQFAALNFFDFVALICNALPTQEADLGRRRAAIVALAFGHLGLCKALLDNGEVPKHQRVARLFQPGVRFCFCRWMYSEDPRSPLRSKLGRPVMVAVVRDNPNLLAWARAQQTLPVNPEITCKYRRLLQDPGYVKLTKFLQMSPWAIMYDEELSPIDAAIVQGHATMLKELLSCLSTFDPRWDTSLDMQLTSLHLACLRGDFEIFDMLLNVRHPAQYHLRDVALQVISRYGRSEFLRQYAATPKYGFRRGTFQNSRQLEYILDTAVECHHNEFLVDLFAEFEKYNINLGEDLLLAGLYSVMAEESMALLQSYLLASACFLTRIPRPYAKKSKRFLEMQVFKWPEGRAVLVDEGVLVGEQPRSLFKICSATIRGHLFHPVFETVQRLPLPKRIKRGLLFKFDG